DARHWRRPHGQSPYGLTETSQALSHARNPTSRWVPSQNGLLLDWPQRQNAAPGRCSSVPSGCTTRIGPLTSSGPSGDGVTSIVAVGGTTSPPGRRHLSAPDGQPPTARASSPGLAAVGSIHGRRSESKTAGKALTHFWEWKQSFGCHSTTISSVAYSRGPTRCGALIIRREGTQPVRRSEFARELMANAVARLRKAQRFVADQRS